MSAIGTKRIFRRVQSMSAFGGKADIGTCLFNQSGNNSKRKLRQVSTNALHRSEFAMLLSATAEEVRALRCRESTGEGAADGLINRQK
jgi:hypothetical protein